MREITITLYTFHELDETAKARARDWLRNGMEYPWFSESIDSIRAFVTRFGANLGDWSLGERGRDYIKTDITAAHFRGLKLRDFSPDEMPTGYCLDTSLWGTFHQEWKRTGDPMYAFEQALEAALSDIAADVEWHYGDEAIDECMDCNNYQFTQEGKFFQ